MMTSVDEIEDLPVSLPLDDMIVGLDIEPAIAQEKKARRDWHYHVVVVPSLRVIGFSILAVFVAVHNLWILEWFSWPLYSRFLVIMGSYCLISWATLACFYHKLRWVNLSSLFLTLDTLFWTLAIYFSGGEKSLLFFLLILRPVDQLHTNFKYVIGFAHLSTLCYIALIGYLYFIEQRSLSLPAEGLKIILIYGTSIYISLAARPAEQMRMRSKAAVRMARDLIRKLQLQSAQLVDAKSKAEAASEAKSQFLANMSHEIRTPMNGVLGMLAILIGTELSERQRHFAATAHRSAETLLDVINDILDFFKIEAGKLELAQADFSLRHTVEETASILAERAHSKGLELACRIDDAVPDSLLGDPIRLRQILVNLIGNAIKFASQGEVVVHISLLKTDADPALIRFAVHDTGMGVPLELQTHLFEAFTQADGSTTRQHNGTGLGLTIAKQLSELMGGSIGMDSRPGEGATFWFTVRLATTPSPAHFRNQRIEELSTCRILIVDDNATNRDILRHQVSAWGMDNSEASNGPQALDLLRHAAHQNCPFDLAILDMHMPGMDGLTLAGIIKADPIISSTSLIILTSAGWHGDMGNARHVGISDYLNKPVRQTELYNSLITTTALQSTAAPTPTFNNPEVTNSLPFTSLQTYPGCRVLLAEDNIVNQEVAESMLQALGCDVDRANNGQEAIEAASQHTYDLILMDCQMPLVDGFEATTAIRQHLSRSETVALPIVALTAHVMEGDRERCLAAGMDDYLSKPFTIDQLNKVLSRHVAHSALLLVPDAARSTDTGSKAICYDSEKPMVNAVLDPEVLEELSAIDQLRGGDVLHKLVELYLLNSPDMIANLRDAVLSNNQEMIRQAAHAFKSSSGHIGALRLAALCESMELRVGIKQAEGRGVVLDAIIAEYEVVREALTAL